MTEKIGAGGKFWVREFPLYLSSHTPGKRNLKTYFNSKGADPNVLRRRRA